MTARLCWIVMLLAGLCPDWGAAQTVYIQGGSYHYDALSYRFTNVTPGVGVEWGTSVVLSSGIYRNSVRTVSLYAALGYRFNGTGRVQPFVLTGAASGYHRVRKDPQGRKAEGKPLAALLFAGADVRVYGPLSLRLMATFDALVYGLTLRL